jgi:hypothetical protein
MISLSDKEVERAIDLCTAIVASANRIEKIVAQSKIEIAQLARDLAFAMAEADKVAALRTAKRED